MNLNGKIVTVFGGSGFIGKYVVRELAQAGYTIRVVTRSPGTAKLLKTAGFVGQVVPVKGDLVDYDMLPKLIENSYAVVNLVGILYESDGRKFNKIHNEAPAQLAKVAKAAGVEKFVHISALVDETSESTYAKSKINGEKAILASFPDAYIFKPSVVFGPEDNFFNKFARMSTISPFLPLIGDGKTRFQPVYVGDVALAVKKVIDEEVKPAAYQLGGPEIVTFKQILNRVQEYTGRKRCYLNLPFCAAKIMSLPLPGCILTADQVRLLEKDNIITSRKTFTELGIEPTAIEAVVPKYLARLKRKTLEVA